MSEPLLHSVHNTSQDGTKVALVRYDHYADAISQFANLNISYSTIHPPPIINMSSSRVLSQASLAHSLNSLNSCNYASYVTSLLQTSNPQDSDVNVTPTHHTIHFRPASLSYSQAA
jgi:hypothetical protein